MLMFVFKNSVRHLHCRAWDKCAVCTTSVSGCPVMYRLHRVHHQGPFLLKLHVCLLCNVDLVKQHGTCIMVATQQPHFAATLPVHSMFPVNVGISIQRQSDPRSHFDADVRAGTSNCDSIAPINWHRACKDLEEGFPMDCTGVRHIEQEEEAPHRTKRKVTPRSPPTPRHVVPHGGGGGGHTCQVKKNKAECYWYSYACHPQAHSNTHHLSQ